VGDVPFSVAFMNSSQNSSSWHWDFGDGGTSTERNPSHTYTALGRYVVRLTASGSDEKSNSASLTITAQKVVQPFSVKHSYGRYWPSHIAGAGDCDFAGHGPLTYLDAVIRTNSDGSQLIVNLHMSATETEYDGSSADGSWSPIVYSAPPGARIATLPSLSQLHEVYIDTSHAYAQSDGNAMGYFYWAGDTDGDDICNTTTDDTNMTFYLNPFTIRLTPR
jgi:PKD repeat protein